MSTTTTNSLREWLDQLPDSVSPDCQAEALLDLLDAYEEALLDLENLADSMADYLEYREMVDWCLRHGAGVDLIEGVDPICCSRYYADEFGRCKHSAGCEWAKESWLVVGYAE